MKIVAITGGIGSGKSVVSQLLRNMGFGVYDTDSQAKLLMSKSVAIKNQLIKHFGKSVLFQGQLNRKALAALVFTDFQALKKLNSIVHPVVRCDLLSWVKTQRQSLCFVETAILHESGLDKMVDAIWHITAPEQVRVQRVMRRSGLTSNQIMDRMKAQETDELCNRYNLVIVNDGIVPVLPQVIKGIKLLK